MHASACDKLALVHRYAREFASHINIDLLLRYAHNNIQTIVSVTKLLIQKSSIFYQ